MGFAARSGIGLLAPFASWVARRAAMHAVPARPETIVPAAPSATALAVPACVRSLRILRVVDGTPRSGAGRMVISGRMDDVCAELDRLVAREAHSVVRPGAA